VEDCFALFTRGKPPEWDEVEPSLQFPINNGVSVDNAKCFDQLIDLKKKSSEKVASTSKISSVYWHTASGADILEN